MLLILSASLTILAARLFFGAFSTCLRLRSACACAHYSGIIVRLPHSPSRRSPERSIFDNNISAFPNAVDYFYSCPMGELFHNRTRFKKLVAKLNLVIQTSDGHSQRKASLEFARILLWADGLQKNGHFWNECKGDDHRIAPPGFAGVELKTIIPSARVVGEYVQRVLRDDQTVVGHFDDNEVSLALKLTYANRTIILRGDGTERN
jgi:hypothetical protein